MVIRVLGLLLAFSSHAMAEVCARDDTGAELCLLEPAQRIVTLSPGATELVFAAGAGGQVIGVVDYSDYPPEAENLPNVGSHTRIDLEALVVLKPDLVVTWVSGNPVEQVTMLDQLGMASFAIEPRTFEGVSSVLERLASLAGTESEGYAAATRFRQGIDELAEQYRGREPVRVFYQVWDQPLMTINDEHLIGKVISLCGGQNIFGEMARLVPRIGPEDVLAGDPEAILSGGGEEDGNSYTSLEHWTQFGSMAAVAAENLFIIPASPISRPTPRLLQGARTICEKLDVARAQLQKQ
jgi:iron complex transport system substrate-binding protein